MKKADRDITFRVHFADGVKLDVTARDAGAAQAVAAKQHPTGEAAVTKVKVVRT